MRGVSTFIPEEKSTFSHLGESRDGSRGGAARRRTALNGKRPKLWSGLLAWVHKRRYDKNDIQRWLACYGWAGLGWRRLLSAPGCPWLPLPVSGEPVQLALERVAATAVETSGKGDISISQPMGGKEEGREGRAAAPDAGSSVQTTPCYKTQQI